MTFVQETTSTSSLMQPPQENCREQYIFLLEFYVRQIRSPRLAKLNEMFFVPTTVAFSFLDLKKDADLELCPVDPLFQPQIGIAGDVEPFYNGRSVLFALGRKAVSDVNKEFIINMCVFKKMPSDIKPDVMVGKGEIDLTLLFAALRKELIDKERYGCADIPNPSKSFEDECPLLYNCCVTGCISVFIRISGFGQSIITEFEGPKTMSATENCDSVQSFLFKANEPYEDDKTLSYKCRLIDPLSCDVSSILSQTNSTTSQSNDNTCHQKKMPCFPCRIPSGALVIGSSDKRTKSSCPPSSCVNDTCCPIQTSRGPKEPCGKAVVLKVSGLVDTCQDGKPHEACVTVAPESEASKPNELQDPDHDVFILRIGKKGLVAEGEKSDIQLEMRTPKGPERRPPLRLETREIQTEEDTGNGKKGDKKRKKK